jgi:hypothetical protein
MGSEYEGEIHPSENVEETLGSGEQPAKGGFASLWGVWRGKVWIADDFDELPDDLAEVFGMRD